MSGIKELFSGSIFDHKVKFVSYLSFFFSADKNVNANLVLTCILEDSCVLFLSIYLSILSSDYDNYLFL